MASRFKAVGFDLDGTFLKTRVNYDKLNNVDKVIMEKHGIPFSMIGFDSLKRRQRAPLKVWLESNGRGDEYDEVNKEIDDGCTEVEKEFVSEAKPFPGSAECIDIIRSKGLKVGILTRGSREYAETALSNCGLSGRFDTIVGRDYTCYDNAKPNPQAMRDFAKELGVQPEDILYVGDNLTDYFAARDSGATFVGVLSGRCQEPDWHAQDPDMKLIQYAGDVVDLI